MKSLANIGYFVLGVFVIFLAIFFFLVFIIVAHSTAVKTITWVNIPKLVIAAYLGTCFVKISTDIGKSWYKQFSQ